LFGSKVNLLGKIYISVLGFLLFSQDRRMDEIGIREDEAFRDFLQELVDHAYLDNPELGITRKVIAEGVDSLSEKQQQIFEINVLRPHTVSKCKLCGDRVPWNEMYEAVSSWEGRCGYCEDKYQKLMSDD
jgi:hypothetical protein